ncbi:MAG: CoA transferase [Chloroflexi bacterium]|nr:CoA transferase [Chloroflexota bacterium]
MSGPLEGIVVLDLSWVLSGPYCTMALADLGAEVIKVERPGIGDGARLTGPFVQGESAYFMSLNRNKKSMTLDLGVPRGRELFLRLVGKADVVVENFTPGTMKKLGLDYEVLQKENLRLVYCAISGFGQTGPYAQRPAFDVIVQGMGGVMSITGEPGGRPLRVGASVGDIVAGLFAAIGICAALAERAQSGLGQMLDISMLDCQVALVENALARYFATGEVPGPLGTRHPAATPFQAFPTRDSWIVVAIAGADPTSWPLFCAAVDHVELVDDPRFASSWERAQHIEVLEPVLTEALRKKTTQEWLDELLPLGIPCGPINTIDRVAQDLQVLQREMITNVPHQRLGMWKYTGTPFKLSRTPGGIQHEPPDLGAHSGEVLQRLLSLNASDVEELRREGVI